jgi:hypothetical protein
MSCGRRESCAANSCYNGQSRPAMPGLLALGRAMTSTTGRDGALPTVLWPRLAVSGGIVHSIGGVEQSQDCSRAAAGQGRIMPRRSFCSMISARPAIAAGPAARESGPGGPSGRGRGSRCSSAVRTRGLELPRIRVDLVLACTFLPRTGARVGLVHPVQVARIAQRSRDSRGGRRSDTTRSRTGIDPIPLLPSVIKFDSPGGRGHVARSHCASA